MTLRKPLLVHHFPIFLALFVAGCDEAESHVYVAKPYSKSGACVEAVVSLDVVTGPAPGNHCDAICLVRTTEANALYVSTMCPPYPPFYDTASISGECGAALEAYKAGRVCQNDAGIP